MHYYFTAVSLIAGICLGFGILYLFIGLRRKDNKPLNITFALFALCYATTLVNGIRWYSTNKITEYVAINRLDSIVVAGAFVALVLYVSYYTGFRPRILLWVLSAAFIVPSLVFIISPATVIGEVSGLTHIILPWGERLADLDSAGSVWLDISLLARLVALGYIIVALIRQFGRGERQPAIILGLGMLPFIVGIFYEVLGESGVVPFIPFGELGFLGIAIAASLQMANSVIKTEEGLAQHRLNLETLVEARTAELKEANQQLVGEIDERKRAEEALRASDRMARALMNAPPDSALLIDPEGIILDINQVGAARLGVSVAQAQGTRVYDLFEPDLAELRRAKVGEVIVTKQPVRWEDVRDGRYVDNNLYPVLDADGAVASIAVFGADITERRHTEAALRQRVEELAVLNRIAHTLATVADLPTALEAISETVTYLFGALYTHVILPVDETNELTRLVGSEREAGPVGRTRVDVPLTELPLVRQVLSQGRSQAVSDLQTQPLLSPVREYLSERNVQSVLLAPLLVRGAAVGLIAVAGDQAGRDFSADEVRLAETIAGDIAAAVENARLLEGAKAAAAAEERNRIARELHDSVTQTMYSVSIVAEALPRLLERNLEEAKRNAAYLRQTTLGALAEMRTLLFELRPGALEKSGLDVLLQQLADVLTGRTRVPVEVTIEGEGKLATDVKIGLYRIAQEAFNNIARHARATNAWASLRRGSDGAILVIRDNGQGFEPESVPPERLGIRIMHERAEEIGTVLTVESQPGDGTEITVEWTNDEE
jgi:PAS domain S-box-containing protein